MEFVVIGAFGLVYLLLAGLLSGDLGAFLRNEWRLMREREWSDGIYDSSANPRPCGRLDPRCQATLKRQMAARAWMKKAGISLLSEDRQPYTRVITKADLAPKRSAKVLPIRRRGK